MPLHITGRGCQLWRPLQDPENFVLVDAEDGTSVMARQYRSLADFDAGSWHSMRSFDGWSC
jgi:hypothetical protein